MSRMRPSKQVLWLAAVVVALPVVAGAWQPQTAQERASWLLARSQSLGGGFAPGAFQQGEVGRADTGSDEPYRPAIGGKAVPLVMSMLLPGAGEAYLGYKRGYVLMAVDIASWFGVKHYHDKGNDIIDEYKIYADEHWSESRFFDAYDRALEYHPGLDYYGQDPSLYVSREDDEREWYENLGKWNQFVFGWDDFDDPRDNYGVGYEPGDAQDLIARWLSDDGVSPHREVYRRMREDSNNQFTNRDRLLYLNIATRVFSVLEVAYLQGMLGGGPKSELKLAGHPVRIIAEPYGWTATRLGVAVSY